MGKKKRKGRAKKNTKRMKIQRANARHQKSPQEHSQAPRLSVCMIVRNEEASLPGCLKSLQGLADELIVVDTGSTDRTVEIAQRYGAKVFHFEWVDDFSAARNESLRHATGDWILWVDADDRINRKYHASIRELTRQPKDRAFAFILENTGGDASTCIQVRMFPNLPGVQFSMPVHEQVTPSLFKLGITKIARVDVVVTHTGYTDEETIRQKKRRYLQIMERWLETHPEDYVTRSHVALTYHTTGRPQAAIREYQKIVADETCKRENPYLYGYAMLFLGRSHIQLGEYQTAISIFQQAQQIGADPTLVNLSLGECYHYLNEPEKAVQHLSYVRDHPMQRTYFPIDLPTIHHAAYHFLGNNLEKLGRIQEALEAYQAALQHDATQPGTWIALASLYQKQGALQAVENVIRQALEREVEHADLYYLLGLCAFEQHRWKQARDHFQQALRLQPSHRGAGNNLGLVLQVLGDGEAARRAYESAIAIHPGNSDALINLAHLCLEQTDYQAAQRYFWKAISIAEPTLDVLLGFAWASAELKEIAQVRLAAEQIAPILSQDGFVGLDPPMEPGALSEWFYRWAEELHQRGHRKLALYATRTTVAMTSDPRAWELMGDLYRKAKRFQEAIESYEKALLAQSPRMREVFLKLGDCYEALGVREAAELCRQQAA